MISASKIKYVKSLGVQKFRRLHTQFVVEGPKMMDELFTSEYVPSEIFATPSWISENQKRASEWQQIITEVSERELSRLSGLKTANKILATVRIPERKFSAKDLDKLVIVLDGIADPGNLGTIIRTADWFGIQNILCSTNTVELYNPKVIQSTMGSLFRVWVFYEDLISVLKNVEDEIPIIGTTLKGDNIYNVNLPERAMLVIGSESHGISPGIQKMLTHQITVPSKNLGTESLNAAVATGIICSEFMRNSLK